MADASHLPRLPRTRLGLSVGRTGAKQAPFQFLPRQPFGKVARYLKQGPKVDPSINAQPVKQMQRVLGGNIT